MDQAWFFVKEIEGRERGEEMVDIVVVCEKGGGCGGILTNDSLALSILFIKKTKIFFHNLF